MSAIPKDAAPRQDKRALWNESKELRDAVRDDLYEWGGANRGGMPQIGYYREQPFSHTPSRMPPCHDLNKVERMDQAFSFWLEFAEAQGGEVRDSIVRYFRVICQYFIKQKPVEVLAKSEKVHTSHYYRLLGEAMYRAWIINQAFYDDSK